MLLALLTLVGCATTPTETSTRPVERPAATATAELEIRAMLLLLTDRKIYEPIAIAQALEGGPDLREAAAITIGRIGDPQGGAVLESLLGDRSVQVRRAAIFALGELGEDGYGLGKLGLLGAVADADREAGLLAVEGLAKSGVDLGEVVERLIRVPTAEFLPRLLPALFRFKSEAVIRWAQLGLEEADPASRRQAAYALAREPQPAGALLLRQLLSDPDPYIRGWAVRGLARVGEPADLDLIRPLLDDAEGSVVVQALRNVRWMIQAGKVAAPASFKAPLLRLLEDARPGVRLGAVEASANWLLDPELANKLQALCHDPVPRVRELALIALAEGHEDVAQVELASLIDDPLPSMRRAVAQAGGFLRYEPALELLALDPDPGVRRAALDARLARPEKEAELFVLPALEDPAIFVRASALDWLAQHPRDLGPIKAALRFKDSAPEAQLAAISALRAYVAARPDQSEDALVLLDKLERHDFFRVRRAAAAAKRALGHQAAAPGAATARAAAIYLDHLRFQEKAPRFEIVTERGRVELELACEQAPLTCANFIQLAGQGFYENLRFHRVLPEFVVQAGDPQDDGYGGPGYEIRDEVNRLRFTPGVIGMAHAGADSAGSQFFITLSAQLHLDGGYTAFGRVVAGFEILGQIIQGEKILKIGRVTE